MTDSLRDAAWSKRSGGRLPDMGVLVVAETPALTAAALESLHHLWTQAFGGRFTEEDADHALGGIHALVVEGGRVLAHAAAVPRTLLVEDRPLRTAYVEAVATLPTHQGRGLGRRVMLAVQEQVRGRFELGALSTGSSGFYERLGWERWRGPTYVLRDGTRVRTVDEDDGLMVLRFGPSSDVDPAAPIACHDRPGDAW